MVPDVLGFVAIDYEGIYRLFSQSSLSLEEILIKSGLNPENEINKQRLAFEFPDNFSFKDADFKRRVLYLFNRHEFSEGKNIDKLVREEDRALKREHIKDELIENYHLPMQSAKTIGHLVGSYTYISHFFNRRKFFSKSKEDRLKKRAIRNIYQIKAKNYLVKKHNWPEKITKTITKGLSLPAYIEKDFEYYKNNKNELIRDLPLLATRGAYQAAEIISASSTIGNYPARFADPTAQFLNIKRKTMTRINIGYDAVMWAAEYGPAHLIVKDIAENGLFNGGPLITDLVKLAGYLYYGAHVLIRTAQIPIRTYYNEAKDKHLPSYATATSPNPIMALTTLPPILYDYNLTRREEKLNNEQIKENKLIEAV